MLFLRSLLLLVALLSPALGQDGSQIAASAKDAEQALQLYLDGVSKSGGRPDYTTPPAADLFRRVFDLEQLTALPPPKASDMPWVIDWIDAAKETNKRIIFFGTKYGPNMDQAAVVRNLAEYEDQYASALNFLIRFAAREATASILFMDQLTPEQRTPIREAGLRKARGGAAGLISNAIGCVALGMRPANARLITAALRDTRDALATFILPNDRTQIIGLLTKATNIVNDDEVQTNFTAFAGALAAAK
jgi:hypothetical protein